MTASPHRRETPATGGGFRALSRPGNSDERAAAAAATRITRADAAVDLLASLAGGGPPGRTDRIRTPAAVESVLAAHGEPLTPGTRSSMERGLGHDLGRVRIHAGSAASLAARSLNAIAFTTGADVVLGGGAPALSSPGGRALLAHELAHVVQAGPADTTLRRIESSSAVVEPTDPDAEGTELTDLVIALATSAGWYAAISLRDVLAGDFVEDPTALAIVVRTLLTLIPGVDTVADVEDLIANIVYAILDPAEKLTSLGWWFTIILSLIGFFPEFGSAIKGIVKLVLKGIGGVAWAGIAGLFSILGSSPAVLDDLLIGCTTLLAKADAWRPWAIAKFKELVTSLLHYLSGLPSAAAQKLCDIFRAMNAGADRWLADAGAEVERRLRPTIDEIRKRLGQAAPKATSELTGDVSREATEEIVEVSTHRLAEDAADEVTEEITKALPDEVTEELTREITDELTDDITDEITRKSTEHFDEVPVTARPDEATGELFEELTRESTEHFDEVPVPMRDELAEATTERFDDAAAQLTDPTDVERLSDVPDEVTAEIANRKEMLDDLANQEHARSEAIAVAADKKKDQAVEALEKKKRVLRPHKGEAISKALEELTNAGFEAGKVERLKEMTRAVVDAFGDPEEFAEALRTIVEQRLKLDGADITDELTRLDKLKGDFPEVSTQPTEKALAYVAAVRKLVGDRAVIEIHRNGVNGVLLVRRNRFGQRLSEIPIFAPGGLVPHDVFMTEVIQGGEAILDFAALELVEKGLGVGPHGAITHFLQELVAEKAIGRTKFASEGVAGYRALMGEVQEALRSRTGAVMISDPEFLLKNAGQLEPAQFKAGTVFWVGTFDRIISLARPEELWPPLRELLELEMGDL